MTFAIRFALATAISLPITALTLAAQAVTPQSEVTSISRLKTTTTWDGTPISYSKTEKPELQTIVVEIAPGSATAWHKHPINNVAYILEGKLRLELENGTTREFKAGEAFAEVVNTWHRGVNTGTGPLKILVVYVSEVGVPLAISKGSKQSE
jgi:quercetin dioxygenase-like cupin family protein